MATGRSRPGPSLRRFPGDRFTTTRRSGHSSPALSTAGRIRSRASCTARAGQAGQRERREPAPDVRLDDDGMAADPDDGDPDDAPVHGRRDPSAQPPTRGAQNASSKTSTSAPDAPSHTLATSNRIAVVLERVAQRGTRRRAAGASGAWTTSPPRSRRRTPCPCASSPRRRRAGPPRRPRDRARRAGSASSARRAEPAPLVDAERRVLARASRVPDARRPP